MRTAPRLLSLFRPYRLRILAVLVLLALQAAVPGLLVLLIEGLLDRVLLARDERALGLLPFAVVGIYALNGLAGFGRGWLARDVAWDLITSLRGRLFEALLRLEPSFHQQEPPARLLSRLVQDVDNVQHGVNGIVTAVQKPLSLLGLIAVAFHMEPQLTLICLFCLPLAAWPIRRFGRALRQRSSQTQESMAALSALAAETFAGIRAVQAGRAEAWRRALFQAANADQRDKQMAAFASRLAASPIIELLAAAAIGLVLWWGGRRVLAGELSPGELIAFLVAMGMVNEPLKGIAEVNALIQRSLAGAESVFALLDRVPTIQDPGGPPPEPGPGLLELQGVHLSYGAEPVLRGVDLRLEPGQTVALVGPSGGGKSTLAALLPRFLDPSAGRLLLDGRDLRRLPLPFLRRQIALVTQEPFLFDDTVLANITLGQDLPQAQVERAARAAHAHDFILALPQGYQTRLLSLGARLSGGQRQRICIARAMLHEAPLLVLDEATSALDNESEAAVQAALDGLRRGRTVLTIAHRLSTVRDADRIIVLDQGRIVEQGRHADLLAQGGLYARLCRAAEAPSG